MGTYDDNGCQLFYDRDGRVTPAMCADYGFRAGSGRLYEEHYGAAPKGVWELVGNCLSTVYQIPLW